LQPTILLPPRLLGIVLFRTGMLGVLGGIYAFGGFCLFGLLHWTLGWF
jgi:hypothetical protein